MNPFYSFLLLLLLLFLLSGIVSSNIGLLVYKITHSRPAAIGTLAVIFLPGTIIHEFAHAAIAQMLGVYVGDMKLMPEVEGKRVKLGSVQVGQSDPFRSFLIGSAPLIVGLALIFTILAIFARLNFSGLWPTLILSYTLFQIGNTMFSSKRDMEGALGLFIALSLVFLAIYLSGTKQFFTRIISQGTALEPFFKMGTASLLKIVVIDFVVITISGIFRKLS